MLARQTVFSGHTWPHALQLAPSVTVFTQTPPQHWPGWPAIEQAEKSGHAPDADADADDDAVEVDVAPVLWPDVELASTDDDARVVLDAPDDELSEAVRVEVGDVVPPVALANADDERLAVAVTEALEVVDAALDEVVAPDDADDPDADAEALVEGPEP